MASAFPQDEKVGMLEISDKKREFDELIAVRGMEFRQKVIEQREMGVQLIKLKHFLTLGSSKPFPTGAFTRLQNNQVWETVLKYVTSSCDIDSTKRTCPTFRDILWGKIPTASPGEREVSAVLKILKKEKYFESSDSSRMYPLIDVPWHLRLVSKSWQRATEQEFLTEFEGDWHLELQLDRLNVGRWWKDNVNVSTIVNVDRAWHLLENSNSRSSLLQIIRLNEHCMTDVGNSFSRILEFLDEYGEHVKGLVVQWKDGSISWALKYLNLLSLVLRMPNLKALTIEANSYCYPPSRKEDMETLKDVIVRHSFPEHSSMEVLSVKGCYYPLSSIVAEIILKCKKLMSVFLSEAVWEKEFTEALEGRSIQYFYKPVKLSLLAMHGPDNLAFLNKELLPWASQFPFRKIILGSDDFETCSERISFVNLFGNTLEYLELFIDPKFLWTPETLQLQLPKLKHLILQTWPGLTNLDFLIPLQSLEHLEFAYNSYLVKYKNPEDKLHLIELNDYAALEKSNVWKCFPHLRTLKLDVFREMYNDDYYGEEDYAYDRCFNQSSYEYFKRGQDITKKFKSTLFVR